MGDTIRAKAVFLHHTIFQTSCALVHRNWTCLPADPHRTTCLCGLSDPLVGLFTLNQIKNQENIKKYFNLINNIKRLRLYVSMNITWSMAKFRSGGQVPPRPDIASRRRIHPLLHFFFSGIPKWPPPLLQGEPTQWVLCIGRHLSTQLLIKNDTIFF